MSIDTQVGRLRWAARAARIAVRDPREGIDRAAIRIGLSHPWAGPQETAKDWRERLHAALGCGWPCQESADFASLYGRIIGELGVQGLVVGRGAYGGWDDADPAFASAVWCLAAHTGARVIVETGVARGVTSRLLLEICERRGEGHLWSIDQPPLDKSLHREIGSAIPERLRPRWTYVRGTSRKQLSRVLRHTGTVDLFVHDSLHTTRNVAFELDRVWPTLATAGTAIVDDVHSNDGFLRFVEATPGAFAIVADHADGRGTFGLLLQRAHGN